MCVLNTSKWKVTGADLEAAADSGNKCDKYWHEKKKKKKFKCLKGTSAVASDSAGNALKPERDEEAGHKHSSQRSQMKAVGLRSACDSVLRIWLSFLGSPTKQLCLTWARLRLR